MQQQLKWQANHFLNGFGEAISVIPERLSLSMFLPDMEGGLAEGSGGVGGFLSVSGIFHSLRAESC